MKINDFAEFQTIIRFEAGRDRHDRYSGNSYCVYWKDLPNAHPELHDVVFIGDYPDVDEEDDCEEIFPKEVRAKGWWLCYRDELIQDAIDNTLSQIPEASMSQLLEAIVYFDRNDSFKEF